MSSFPEDEFPPLDCHAHIAADVTASELMDLGPAQIFAVTRSLAEAEAVLPRDDGLVWGCGVHPGDQIARAAFDPSTFERLLSSFVLVGEIGLDRRRGALDEQRRIFGSILEMTAERSVLLSIHSLGAVGDVLEELDRYRQRGAILHWFLGSQSDVMRATDLGAYYSVNAAMEPDQLLSLPRERVLPETDFPASRTNARMPGDVEGVETALAAAWGLATSEVRPQLYRNLRALALQARCLKRLPDNLSALLLTA